MTRFLRTLIGALIGSLLVLIVNPRSRPYVLCLTTTFGEAQHLHTTPLIANNNRALERPEGLKKKEMLILASIWMDVGAEKIRYPAESTRVDYLKLLKVAQMASSLDKTNAYWLQMQAIIHEALGEREQALKEWINASKRTTWNDFQTDRLKIVQEQIQARYHYDQAAWTCYATYQYRSLQGALAIEKFCRMLTETYNMESIRGLEIRLATLKNGVQLKLGAKSLEIARIGVNMIEMASYPPNMEASPSQRALTIARFELINKLRIFCSVEEIKEVNTAFRENDGWTYKIESQNPDEKIKSYALYSLLISTIPGSLVAVSIFGSLLWLVGGLLIRYPIARSFLQIPLAPILGVALGIAVYYFARLSMVALATTAIFGFATFAPRHERTHPSEYLGPFFRFTIVVIALALTFTVGCFCIGLTAPCLELHRFIGIPSEFVNGSGMFIGLALVSQGLLFLVAPSWSVVRKLNTPWVFSIGLRDLGKGLCLGAAILAVITTPISVYLDGRFYGVGDKILKSAPNHFNSL